MRKLLAAAALAAALAGCESTAQYSSGAAYLDRYEADMRAAGLATEDAAASAPASAASVAGDSRVLSVNEEVMRVAAMEPILRLPARIGVARIDVARIDGGSVGPIPDAEQAGWAALAQELGADFGEFVPVNALTARMLADRSGERRFYGGDQVFEAVRAARLGAAAQHLDAVLIYQLGAATGSESTAFSLLNWTVIGAAMLPGRENTATATAVATLIDVRNGYPYGTAQAEAAKSRYSPAFNSSDSRGVARREAEAEAFDALIPEVKDMAYKLAAKMAATR